MLTNYKVSMMYTRNAWWKMKQQEGEEGNRKKEDGDDDGVPVAADGVTLIPNREDVGMLVSCIDNDTGTPAHLICLTSLVPILPSFCK